MDRRGLHLSGADEQGPQDAVVVTVDYTKILWLLRLNGEPEWTVCRDPSRLPRPLTCAAEARKKGLPALDGP